MIDHLIHGHRQRVFVPVQGHAKAIADTDDVDAGPLRPGGGHRFADSHHDQTFTRRFLRGEVRDRQFHSFGHRHKLVPIGTMLA